MFIKNRKGNNFAKNYQLSSKLTGVTSFHNCIVAKNVHRGAFLLAVVTYSFNQFWYSIKLKKKQVENHFQIVKFLKYVYYFMLLNRIKEFVFHKSGWQLWILISFFLAALPEILAIEKKVKQVFLKSPTQLPKMFTRVS